MLCTFSLTGYAEKNKIKKYKKRKGVEIIMYTEDNFDRQTDRQTELILFYLGTILKIKRHVKRDAL